MVRGIVRPVIQYVAQKYGPKVASYVKTEYGQVAGSIVGTGIGIIAGGDIITAINKGLGGGESPYDRNPPFGYFDGAGPINGPSNGSFHQTLRPTSYKSNFNRRVRKQHNYCVCRTKRKQYRNRSTRRKFY